MVTLPLTLLSPSSTKLGVPTPAAVFQIRVSLREIPMPIFLAVRIRERATGGGQQLPTQSVNRRHGTKRLKCGRPSAVPAAARGSVSFLSSHEPSTHPSLQALLPSLKERRLGPHASLEHLF